MAEELRTFAYICPECRQTVIAQRSAFSLAAGDCKIPCPCGKSTLSIENMGSMYHPVSYTHLTLPTKLEV